MDPEWRASLPDGSALLIRRITPKDAPALLAGFAELSEESRRLRFLTAKPRLTRAELRYFTEVDGHDHEALAAIDERTGDGVGIARFVRDPADPRRAEVAVTVADEWQRRGVGTLLLDCLGQRARQENIASYTALVSSENQAMHHLLTQVGVAVRAQGSNGDAVEYEIALPPRGVGEQLAAALRGAAAGRLDPPPGVLRLLRKMVPFRTGPDRSSPDASKRA